MTRVNFHAFSMTKPLIISDILKPKDDMRRQRNTLNAVVFFSVFFARDIRVLETYYSIVNMACVDRKVTPLGESNAK